MKLLQTAGTFILALWALRIADLFIATDHYFVGGAVEGIILAAVYVVGDFHGSDAS